MKFFVFRSRQNNRCFGVYLPDGDPATCCSDLMEHTYAGVHETCHKLDATMREQQ